MRHCFHHVELIRNPKMVTTVLLNSQQIPIQSAADAKQLIERIESTLNLRSTEYYLTQNGKRYTVTSKIDDNSNNAAVHIHLRVLGGKGGFGSMLRAIGAQIEKTTNREACRDLSGRRLRDINEEKRLKSWLDKQQEREEEAAAKTSRKIEKLQAKPKHEFKDDKYFNARSNLEQNVSDALEEGLKNAGTASTSSNGSSSESPKIHSVDECNEAGGSGIKRKSPSADKAVKNKKKKKKIIKGALWLDEGLSSSDSEDSDDTEEGNNSSDAAADTNHHSTKSKQGTSKNAVAVV